MGSSGSRESWGRRARRYRPSLSSLTQWRHFQLATTAAELLLWVVAIFHLQAWNRLLHFTWWGIAFHAVTMLLALFGRADWRTDMCIQAVVITGVWYMSAMRCDMLVSAEEEMGAFAYAGGNFFIHYFPFVSATARRKLEPQKPDPTALLLWLGYNALSRDYDTTPSDTYGCNAPYELVVMSGTAAALVATFLTHRSKPCAKPPYYAD